jgi:hypothetical protein
MLIAVRARVVICLDHGFRGFRRVQDVLGEEDAFE